MQKPADPISEPPDLTLPRGPTIPIREIALFLSENAGRRVVIGQQEVGYKEHKKKESFDYWLRTVAGAQNKSQETMWANQSVINKLVAMGLFERLPKGVICPTSKNPCDGIGLTKLGIAFAKQFQAERTPTSREGGAS